MFGLAKKRKEAEKKFNTDTNLFFTRMIDDNNIELLVVDQLKAQYIYIDSINAFKINSEYKWLDDNMYKLQEMMLFDDLFIAIKKHVMESGKYSKSDVPLDELIYQGIIKG